ncbi:MAG: family 78 glycoside hydrolase catalytic domain [Paracholeplasma sp.]|nr:family 78 glycoside hydrolase catalytic domain [Paracholeplasma sp.]MDY3195520.1 family 78 glycoside hydrolase catalytic domain [Paracholeplasma sp.]
MFQNAKWIWHHNIIQKNDYGVFVKSFEVGRFNKAILNISGHNHIKLYINDKLISGYVTPAPSGLHPKSYLSYDVSKDLLEGNNTIKVVVLYLGGSGQNYQNGIPGFILNLEIDEEAGVRHILSDETFSSIKNHPYVTGQPFQQNRRITPVERFDSSKLDEVPIHEPVLVLEGYHNYRKQTIKEGIVHKTYEPRLLSQSNTVYVFDADRIVSGFVRLDVLSQTNQVLRVRYSEDLEGNRVKHNVANEPSETYYDELILKKGMRVSHAFDFTYKAFRYAEVEGNLDELESFSLKVELASTDLGIVGDLKSKSYPMITDLFTLFKHTQTNNTLGLLVDCPHREQAQYLGDSALQAESIIYNVKERKPLLEKVLDDFMDAQYTDGTFPFVSPGSTNDEEFSLKIPEYDLYFIELVEKRYQIDLDQKILDRYYEPSKKLVDHYISKIDEQGLVRKNEHWHISDWPYPSVDQEGDYLCFENMHFHKNLSSFIKLYQDRIEQDYYLKLRDALYLRIREVFLERGLFKDHEKAVSYHQGIQAFALNHGFVLDSELDAVITYIKQSGFSSSIILGRDVVHALLKSGYTKEALDYMFNYEKGWGTILRHGSKTMWEGFDDIESHSHAWGMYVVRLIQTYLVGINVINPDTYIIKPTMIDEVKDIAATIVTERGLLSFSYEVKESEVIYTYDIPLGLQVSLIHNQLTFNLKSKGILKCKKEAVV